MPRAKLSLRVIVKNRVNTESIFKMTIRILLILLASTNYCFGQIDSSYVKELDCLRTKKEFKKITESLENRINQDKENLYYIYQSACYNSLLSDTIEAFNKIVHALKLGKSSEDIITESDFNGLHGLKSWHNLVDTIIENYLRINPQIIDKNLSVELWLMYIEDQRDRTFYKNNKSDSPIETYPYYPLEYSANKDVKQRTKRLEKIIKIYGWPKYSIVGKNAGDGAFFVIQHSEPKILNKYFPLFEKAVDDNEASKKLFALMVDRKLMYEGKKQKYGSQLQRWGTFINGKYITTPYHLWPVEDEINLNSRRASMGLVPIEEYVKQWNYKYEYKPENETKSVKQIIKRWH